MAGLTEEQREALADQIKAARTAEVQGVRADTAALELWKLVRGLRGALGRHRTRLISLGPTVEGIAAVQLEQYAARVSRWIQELDDAHGELLRCRPAPEDEPV
jgi:hypothetical protein